MGQHFLAMLIAGLVEHNGYGDFRMQFPQFVEPVTDALGLDIRMIDDTDQLVADGVDRPQDIEPLAARGRLNKGAAEAPDHGEKGSVNEVCRINKIDMSLAGLRLI